ncbi:hypothetical protein PENTCL1PPCAC_29162 [Pristionchus entomophagus]|uniref:Uncharacterized protein n=1 Tax=Pristionchus entomophagus TaxID=358040 RepID=A0AAV5UL04_9BILA|nr:hypothetical protein PENTCL1PPCAC_29162 [Pristionchus entomophagus]
MSQEKGEKSMEEKMSRRFQCARTCCLALCTAIMFASMTTFILTADALHKFSYVTSLLGTNIFIYGIVVLLFISLFSLLITPAMIYALIKQNQSLFTMLTFTTLSIGSMGILAAILGFCLHVELTDESQRDWMGEGLRREYGHPQDYHVTNAWDRLQSEMKCCGVATEVEWISSDWYLGQVKYPRRRRPGSCCKSCADARDKICKNSFFESMSQSERRTCTLLSSLCPSFDSSEVNESVCTGNKLGPGEMPMDAFVHSEGCFPILETHLRFYSIILIVGGLLLAILLFSQTISAFVMNYSTDPLLYDAVNTVETSN